MILTEINVDDLNTLEEFRMERFLHVFISNLSRCLIEIDSSNTLIVHCPDSGIVDELLDDLEDLCSLAWVILGVRAISLYFCEEEILQTATYGH